MAQLKFEIVNPKDIDSLVDICDEVFLYLKSNDRELKLCDNNARGIYLIGMEPIYLLMSGSYNECTKAMSYLQSCNFTLYDKECSGVENEKVFSNVFSPSVVYTDFRFSKEKNIPLTLEGIERPIDYIVSGMISDMYRVIKDSSIIKSVNLVCSDMCGFDYNKNDKSLKLIGNPVNAMSKFVESISKVAVKLINFEHHKKLLRGFNICTQDNLIERWAYVELVKGMLTLNDMQLPAEECTDFKLEPTSLFGDEFGLDL